MNIVQIFQTNMMFSTAIVFMAFLIYSGNCDSVSDKRLTDSINYFSLNFYKELIKTEKENIICSGFSLSSVLNMLLAGARGNTSAEINTTLGYEKFGLSQQEIENSLRQLLTHQRGNHSGYDLEVANSAWLQTGFNVLPDFKANINNNFFVEEKELDFASGSAKDQINAWVNEKTKGRIPTLFNSPFDPLTRLVLANAVYFKGTWLTQFDKDSTSDRDFISKDGNKRVPMMYVDANFTYSDNADLNAQILELPYQGGDVSMIIILPKEIDGLETLENNLTLDSLNSAINGTANAEVKVTLPKFNISSELKLNPVLQSLGIARAFIQSDADLSGINGGKDLYVSNSIQKADIEVNEEGTVASAASAITITTYSFKPWEIYFVANHPFLFFIRQKSTGIILFSGRVANF